MSEPTSDAETGGDDMVFRGRPRTRFFQNVLGEFVLLQEETGPDKEDQFIFLTVHDWVTVTRHIMAVLDAEGLLGPGGAHHG